MQHTWLQKYKYIIKSNVNNEEATHDAQKISLAVTTITTIISISNSVVVPSALQGCKSIKLRIVELRKRKENNDLITILNMLF
jgi:hypothetical protein